MPGLARLSISDWTDPTFEDYRLIQEYLKWRCSKAIEIPVNERCFANERLNRDLYGWITYRLGRLNLIDTSEVMPLCETVYINGDPDYREQCIICYASYAMPGAEDRDYKRGIDLIIRALKRTRFNGHFIYRVGGWPNLEKGRLKFADVPYAFKPFFLEEIRDRGYKKILWVDAASVPVRSVQPIFDHLEKEGCCYIFDGGIVNDQTINDRAYVAKAMGLLSIKKPCPSIISQIVGFNMGNRRAAHLLDLWIKAAERKLPFLEPSADQFSFNLLVNHLELLQAGLPKGFCMEGDRSYMSWKNKPACIIYHHYGFLDPREQIPKYFLS